MGDDVCKTEEHAKEECAEANVELAPSEEEEAKGEEKGESEVDAAVVAELAKAVMAELRGLEDRVEMIAEDCTDLSATATALRTALATLRSDAFHGL